jgi:hypothetical protein
MGDGSATKRRTQVTRRHSEPGKLGKWADAARRVLEMEGRPLTVREIADKALEHGEGLFPQYFWSFCCVDVDIFVVAVGTTLSLS